VTPLATIVLNGEEMDTKTETQLDVIDAGAKTPRSNLALFIVCELLCTGAFVVLAILYI
jgi:hypothetical protein